MRIDLNVPFAEKDLAKKMGAKWDPKKKVWYVPSGGKCKDFEKWAVTPAKFDFKANSFCIAETSGACWQCSINTRFITISLYPGFLANRPLGDDFEDLDDELEEPEANKSSLTAEWFECNFHTLLYYVRDFSDTVQKEMHSFCSQYKLSSSSTARMAYWMNHCEQCGVKQGDFREYCEPDGLFRLHGEHNKSRIALHQINKPVIVSCDGYLHERDVENLW